jgi:hypothetical protein
VYRRCRRRKTSTVSLSTFSLGCRQPSVSHSGSPALANLVAGRAAAGAAKLCTRAVLPVVRCSSYGVLAVARWPTACCVVYCNLFHAMAHAPQ